MKLIDTSVWHGDPLVAYIAGWVKQFEREHALLIAASPLS